VAARRTVDTPSGEVTVTVAAPVDQEVARSLDAVRRALRIGLPLLVGLVALAAWWTAGRALRPVERLRAEADAISASTLHRRVSEPGTGDEVHRLSRTMNAMLERLEGAVTRQRQFVADASHELRNPVAAMRTDLEAALCEGDRADWPTVAREVLAEEARVEALIGDLLVLAAEDEGAATLPGTDVDLNELAAAEARRGRNVQVSSAPDSDRVVVVGSHRQLERALANLVDNAERHADSQVRISTTNQAGWAQLWVDDDGPGIPAADRDRVFERFTRLDDSRARDQGGSGLGLAMVRSIVTRHRGSVWAEQSPLGGARFIIALPMAGPSSATDRRILSRTD
jgi:signal transduction histidine kinase